MIWGSPNPRSASTAASALVAKVGITSWPRSLTASKTLSVYTPAYFWLNIQCSIVFITNFIKRKYQAHNYPFLLWPHCKLGCTDPLLLQPCDQGYLRFHPERLIFDQFSSEFLISVWMKVIKFSMLEFTLNYHPTCKAATHSLTSSRMWFSVTAKKSSTVVMSSTASVRIRTFKMNNSF